MFQRIILFLITNLAVIVLINIVLIVLSYVFWINLSWYGVNYISMAIFATVVWFSWAFISLMMSKFLAKKAYRIKPISAKDISLLSKKERLVYDTVENISRNHGIKMPEVGFYNSPTMNAFATGSGKNNSLVAVSTGLLMEMTDWEIEAVVGHEMAHVLNGDMVTMVLLQWVMNTFVIFLSRVIANLLSQRLWWENSTLIYFITAIVLDICFGILASIVVMWFSRKREFRADEGAARFVWKEKMILALQALEHGRWKSDAPKNMATSMISNRYMGGFQWLFMSHPPIQSRIDNLQNYIIR